MNDDMSNEEPSTEQGSADEQLVDAELVSVGEELRREAAPVEGREVIVSTLRRRAARSRRASWLVAGVATLLVAGSVGAVVAERDAGSDRDATASQGEAGGAAGRARDDSDAAALVASLPPEPVDPHSVQLIASVSRYDTCDALLDELHRVGAAHVGSRGFGSYDVFGYRYGELALTGDGDAARSFAPGAASDAAAESGQAAAGETLGTNVIVAGVDEPDTVKATDTLVVELSGQSLRIVDTRGPGIVGGVQLVDEPLSRERSSYPSSLLVDGRRAVVFGHESVLADAIPGDPSAARPSVNYLTVTFVDLTDATAPRITDRVRIEGGLVAVRRVGDQVRMVTSSSLADLPIVVPTTPNSVAPALEQNRFAVAESAVGDWIPDWDRGESTEPEPLLGCGDVVVPDTFAGVQMTSLVQFDVDGPFAPQSIGLLAPSENLTATATDVVVASHVWVDPIDRTDDFTDWSTALHRFTFADDDAGPTYVASGAVDGSIRDEFSMSVLEDGTVGVVTVDMVPWQSRDQADITVRLLSSDVEAATLDEVGSLVPAASTDSLAGVRFIGDRLLVSSGPAGNVVSVVDLSDRTAPRDLGKVDMRGSGAYLHPLEGNRVLAIGSTLRKEGERFRTGMHASLLDLNDTPAVVGVWALDDADTPVGYDHHAFTWWPGRSMAGFGINHYSRSGEPPPPDAAFLTIDGDAIVPRIVRPREADLGPKCPPTQLDRSRCDDTGPPDVQRVLVVDGNPWLYTSESLERLDGESFASAAIVPLRRWGQ